MTAACTDPVPALKFALQSLALSEQDPHDSLHACALSVVAGTLLRLGDVQLAFILLRATMAKVMETAPVTRIPA